jgi:hypothetical protein
MSIFLFISCIFFSCSSRDKTNGNTNKINYQHVEASVEALKVRIDMNGSFPKNKLLIQMDLENLTNRSIQINQINVENEEGIRARILDTLQFPLIIGAGTVKLTDLNFYPINDFRMFDISGDPGMLRDNYNLIIEYNDLGSDMTLKKRIDVNKEDYLSYKKMFKETTACYMLKPDSNLASKQSKYQASVLNVASFAHIGDGEIAAAGLNFRIKVFHRNDTTYANLFVVNHAEFPVMINPGKLQIKSGNSKINDKKQSTKIQKIGGSPDDKMIIRNGDRAIISFNFFTKKKQIDDLNLCLKDVFVMPDRKSLFLSNFQLNQIK